MPLAASFELDCGTLSVLRCYLSGGFERVAFLRNPLFISKSPGSVSTKYLQDQVNISVQILSRHHLQASTTVFRHRYLFAGTRAYRNHAFSTIVQHPEAF